MKKILQVAGIALVAGVMAGMNTVNADSSDVRGNLVSVYQNTDPSLEQFNTVGQPFLVLRYKEGWKYPVVMKGDPRCYRWDILLLGAHSDHYKENRLVKKSRDLENLAVLRSIENYIDGGYGIKIDKQYQGSREAYAAIMLEKLLNFVGLGSSAGYKGTILADEYNDGLPMRWVLGSASDVKGLSKYFAKQDITPAANKPLLLLQILDKKSELGKEELDFLNSYFTLLDPKSPAVKAFFDGAEEYLAESAGGSKDAKNVLETSSDTFFRTVVDKYAEGLDAKKLAGVAFGAAVFIGAALMKDEISDAIRGTGAWKATRNVFVDQVGVDKDNKPVYAASNITKGIVATLGGAAVLFIAYKIVSEMLKSDDADFEAEAEEGVNA